ncbi:MAG: CBS domain-containing protein [Candidatus Hydrothermarchaeales archaeon]
MSRNVDTLPTEAYVIEAIKKMFDKKIGSIVIVEGAKMVGILSERDLVYKLYLRADNPVSVKVTEIMSKDPVSISPDESILDAAVLMQKRGFRRLPVLENNRLVGFITQSDLLKAMVSGISRFE